MMYETADVVRFVRAYVNCKDGIRTLMLTHPFQQNWMEDMRFRFLNSPDFENLIDKYDASVPVPVRNELDGDLNFLLHRTMNPTQENDPRLPNPHRSFRQILGGKLDEPESFYDEGEGND